MATELEYFRQFAQEYSAMNDNEVNVWIGIAQELVERMFDATDNRMAMCDALYAAHMIKLQEIYVEEGAGSGGSGGSGGGTTPGGDLIAEKEGDLERRYSAASTTNGSTGSGTSSSTSITNPMAVTYYGRMFLSISNAVVGAPIMTRMG